MAEGSSETAEATGAAGGALPHSWLRVFLGLAACSVAAVACAIVVRQYLRTRPENLRGYTAALADILEQSFLENRVLEEDVQRRGLEVRRDARAFWDFFEFDVTVPAAIDAEGLREIVAGKMLDYSVSTAEAPPSDAGREWLLALGPREFARVRVRQEMRHVNLTSETVEIARTAVSTLQDMGVPAGQIARSEPKLKGNDQASWSFTRLEAVLPAPRTVFGFESALKADLAGHDVRIRPRVPIGGAAVVTVSLQGVDCVEVVLERARGRSYSDTLPPVRLPVLPRLKDPLAEAPDSDAQAGYDETPDAPPETGPSEQAAPVPEAGAAAAVEAPRVAIIIDDNGYGGEATERLLALDPALTLSVLPNTPYATETAQRAGELGFEVMLHMPMEKADMAGQVAVGMSQEVMRRLVDDALSQVPGAVGLNNHMGSLFTRTEAAVTTLMAALKDTPLFFIDSRTTAQTKAFDAAQAAGIPSASRKVFLDNEQDPAYIRTQLAELVAVAKEQGRAIGIGHCKPVTADVLADALPGLAQQGVRLVHVSEVLE